MESDPACILRRNNASIMKIRLNFLTTKLVKLLMFSLGVLLSIQHYFDVSNASAGLLQTVFIISYMIVAPLFGYLGDRYNRKIVMVVGMFIWSGATLLASFITDDKVSV